MRKALVMALALGVGMTVFAAGPVKDDPNELPDGQLVQYFNRRRNMDRWLQQGNYGSVIGTAKQVLREQVREDAYTAFCMAAAYASLDPGEDDEEGVIAEAISYLDKAIEWGFRNVDILKTSSHFDNLREEKEFKSIIAHLEKTLKQEDDALRSGFAATVRKGMKKIAAFDVDKTAAIGEAIDADAFAGKPMLVVVIRPQHPGVMSAVASLNALAAKAKEKGVFLLGAVYNYEYTPRLRKQAADFVAAQKFPFPCVLVDRSWTRKYGVLNLPSHLLVNKEGDVCYRADGWQEAWRLEGFLEAIAK